MKLETAYNYFEKLEKDERLQNYISQANSRYILYIANEPLENFPHYTVNLDEKCTHIAFSYLNCGWRFFLEKISDEATKCMEKASEILEYLYAYNDCEKLYKEYYRLVCSLAYYISAQYSKSFIILGKYNSDSYIGKITKLFLTRNFIELERQLEIKYLKNDEETSSENKDNIIYEKILSNAFLHIINFIRTGKMESLESSKDMVRDLITLADINNEPHMWWYFRLLYLVFEEYEDGSLWKVVPPLLDNDDISAKYIYANLYKKKPITEFFKSQRECLDGELLKNDGFVIGMPTSSGKTKVAEVTILKTLTKSPDALCIYIAPYRSLANEVEFSLSSMFEIMGYQVSQLYGGSQTSPLDRQLTKQANVIIVTPEKAKSMLRSNKDLKDRIQLVIIDEGHLVGFQPRYITGELLIEELKIVLKKNNGQLVLLSAVLPNISDFSLWIGEDDKAKRMSVWRPSSQRFGELSLVRNTVNINWEGETPSYNKNFITPKLVKPERITKTGRKYAAKYFPADKKEGVAATATKMLDVGSVLIYVGRSNMVLSQARIVSKLFEEKGIEHEWRNKNDWLFVELACIEEYGEDSEILSLLKQGIVPHSSILPTEVRQSIEKLMANDNPKIIIATSTLGQGVNIGVSTVIVSNVYLDESNTVKVNDFWNIAGRAGRAFTDTEGKILYAIDRNKSQWSIYNQIQMKEMYFQYGNIEKATSGLYLLLRYLFILSERFEIEYSLFLELLAENRESIDEQKVMEFFSEADQFLELLDDTLISMDIMNEANVLENSSSWIDDVFRSSLAFIQAKQDQSFSEEKIIEILKARNSGVIKLAGEGTKWHSIASSSVPLRASLVIEHRIDELLKYIRKYIDSDRGFEDLLSLVMELDIFIDSLPISKIEGIEIGANFSKIREGWFSGTSIHILEKEHENARSICNEYYSFHFPWIVNAIAQKIKLINCQEESKVLEQISLFAEIGLNNNKSVKIYLAGIKSRNCATELSEKIGMDNDLVTPVKELLLEFFHLCVVDKEDCSEICFNWLKLLNDEKEAKEYVKVKRRSFQFNIPFDLHDNLLYIKKVQNEIWLCSFDYKIKIPVLKEKELFDECSDIPDIFLRKEKGDVWILDSHNPYIIFC